MDKKTFVTLHKSLVRSYLEYAIAVWSPHAILKIENVQKGQQNWFMDVKDYHIQIV